MKTFSNYLFIVCISFCTGSAIGQSETITNLQSNSIKFESDYLNVNINTWDENYIQVESKVVINMKDGKERHHLAINNGLEAIFIQSNLDVGGIEQMVITTDSKGNKTFTPTSKWDSENNKWKFNSLNIGHDIEGTVTLNIPRNMSIDIKSTYGNVVLDGVYQQIETCSTYGMIEAKLDKVSDMRKVNFTSTYDFVDLTLDSKSDAKLNLSSTYGEVFTDLPLQSNGSSKSEKQSCIKRGDRYVLNDGTVAINIVATYDNIYVRASEK